MALPFLFHCNEKFIHATLEKIASSQQKKPFKYGVMSAPNYMKYLHFLYENISYKHA